VSALDYAGLVGRYVRMERPLVEVEYLERRAEGLEPGAPWVIEGTVAYVYDNPAGRSGGPCVEVVMDYGMGTPVFPDEEWTLHVWASERVAAIFEPTVRDAIRRRRAYQEGR
jgi:hypothetical protein